MLHSLLTLKASSNVFVLLFIITDTTNTLFDQYFPGDLLENYCWDDDLMNISRLLFSITILLTYPIECFVTREVIQNSLFSAPISERTHYLITLCVVGTAYLISISTDCLGVVLELNVSTYFLLLSYTDMTTRLCTL